MPPRDTSNRLSEPLVYFIDRCLGTGDVSREVTQGLLPGESVKLPDDLLTPNSLDVRWLSLVGHHQWVGLTKDDAIRRRPAEVKALLAANSAIFIFANAGVTGLVIGAAFRTAMPRIRKAVRRFAPPMIGRVNQAGELSILWHGGIEMKRAIYIK